MLVLERDQLLLQECKSIEMVYMLKVGHIEYKLYQIECAVLRAKRKAEIIQARKNRQEKVILDELDAWLDEEFAEYTEKLNKQMDAVNDAFAREKGEVLSAKETAEMKKLYRDIVKALHPDLHSDLDDRHLELFLNAVTAYECGDLENLRIIHTMIDQPLPGAVEKGGFQYLKEEGERLKKLTSSVNVQIEEIKTTFPYTVKKFIADEAAVHERLCEAEAEIAEYQIIHEEYKNRIVEMLGGGI
jgi:hypothetical protein